MSTEGDQSVQAKSEDAADDEVSRESDSGKAHSERADDSERPRRSSERSGEGRARAKRRRVEEVEPIPTFSGRMYWVVGFIAAAVLFPLSDLGNVFEPKDRTAVATDVAWKIGDTATVAITLITADYNLLTCASPTEIAGMHCQYKAEKEMWPRPSDGPLDDNKKELIQPYRTANENRLLLVGGLWATPAVAMRLHSEPPTGVAQEKLARFLATCKVKFVGELAETRLRWNPSGQWMNPDAQALVAQPISCTVGNPP